MTKKRFLSIILTVLMVLSIVPATPAHAFRIGDKACAGVANTKVLVYSTPGGTTKLGELIKGQGFTILGTTTQKETTYCYINYNNSGDPDGTRSYGYIKLYDDITVEYGSMANVKYNVSVYYGIGSKY